ncbi:MAG: type II secretion system F family protein [Acidimicrobiia bacterium]|nr:type II secretion system F family protein [Acidimicrobiia bacterium]
MTWAARRVRMRLDASPAARATPPVVPQVWRTWVVISLVWAAVAIAVGWWCLAAVLVWRAVRPRVQRVVERRRAAASYEADLVLALRSVAAALRTGATVRQAVSEALSTPPATRHDDLRRLGEAVERGADLQVSLAGWAHGPASGGTSIAAGGLTLAAELGGSGAALADALADALAARLDARAAARAVASQARLSAAVLVASPLLVAAMGVGTGSAGAQFLFHTELGLACLVAGLGLDALGAWWMSRLVRFAP